MNLEKLIAIGLSVAGVLGICFTIIFIVVKCSH
jgi:hypothetical protein